MNTLRNSIFCFGALLLASPLVWAQDFSKYREFSLGSSVATVLKRTEQAPKDVKVIHAQPTLVQELTWWPPTVPGVSYRADSVERMLFSFCDGELYKISVTYDATSTQGLTAGDMVKSISAKYGPATSIVPETDSATNDRYEAREKIVASWEDAQYSFNLGRSSSTDGFELVICSKRVNVEDQAAIVEAVKLEEQEGPNREAERQKKDANDLEVTRQKNQKSFRP